MTEKQKREAQGHPRQMFSQTEQERTGQVVEMMFRGGTTIEGRG